MNCDQVFDILTRGPFPTGTACDTGVEAHLSDCPECHRLAEALRPAIELFQEAIGPEESRDLPGYWCAVASERKQPGVSCAEQDEPAIVARRIQPKKSLSSRLSALAAWRLAAALALGVTLGSVLNSRGPLQRFSTSPTDLNAAAVGGPGERKEHARFTEAEHKILAALPAACFRNKPAQAPRYIVPGGRVLANADLASLNCCTECHHLHSDSVPSNATAAVSQSCQFCHRN